MSHIPTSDWKLFMNDVTGLNNNQRILLRLIYALPTTDIIIIV